MPGPTSVIQPSFASGELSPSLYARVDMAAYRTGAAAVRNFFVDYRGGLASRPGTRFVALSSTSAASFGLPPRIIRFQFSTLQDYVLEFGNGYIAFYKNGAQIVTAPNTPYTIASPYALADLPLLKVLQSNDVLTLTHTSYAPRQLNRMGDTNWTLTTITYAPSQTAPTGGAAVATHGSESAASGDATTTTYTYCVTAVSFAGEESEPSASFSTAANSRIMSQDGNAYVTATWTAPSGTAPAFYNVYRAGEVPNGAAPNGAVFGLIGSSTLTTFVDRDGAPDFSTSPPYANNPFAGGNNPGPSTYFGQRQWYGGSLSLPETLNASKIGAFTNFDQSQPVQSSDAITATTASTQVNAIKHLISMPTGIVALSSGGAWLISGGSVGQGGVPGPITPSNLVAQPQAYNGCGDVPPIVANYDVLFITPNGIVRDLSYNFYVNIYTGQDMTARSNHLFAKNRIIQWAYADEPYKVVWCVRDDGILLGWTYVKEQEVYAWTRHDTLGQFVSVCSVIENGIAATYFVVKRTLGGAPKYCIERLADRGNLDGNPALGMPANVENAWCVDCGLALPQPTPAANLTIGAPASAAGDVTALTADAAVFSSGSVGSMVRANGGRAVITAYVNPTLVTASVLVPFPAQPNDPLGTPLPAPSGAWTMTAPVTVISGLDYLDGMTVAILADGNVMPQQTVTAGSITLPAAASAVVVGLPFQAQVQTLRIDVGDGQPGGSIQGKIKKIGAVTIRVKDTRGLKAGRTPATVVPIKEWSSNVNLGGPLPLVTGDYRVILDPLHDVGGQLWLQLDDPVPATVLGLVPELAVA